MRNAIFTVGAIAFSSPVYGQGAQLSHSAICPGSPDPVPAAAFVSKVKKSAVASARKDEFETSDQFQNRLTQLLERDFPNSLVSVAVPIASYKISYDADRRRLAFDFLRSDYGVSRSNLAVTEVDRESRVDGYYEAQNSYGATVEVEKRTDIEVVIAWDGLTSAVTGTKAYLQVAPEVARSLKENSELVIVGSLVAPFLQQRYDLDLPTLASPIRRSTTSYALTVKSKCIYLRGPGGQSFGLSIAE